LHIPPLKKKNNKPNQRQKTQPKPTQNKTKKTPRKLSFLLSLVLGVYYRHSVLTLKYFYCSFLLTANGFDYSLLVLYFLTQSSAVLEKDGSKIAFFLALLLLYFSW